MKLQKIKILKQLHFSFQICCWVVVFFRFGCCVSIDTDREDRDAVPSNFVPWGYEGWAGPQHWDDYYKKCKGNRQSPIDINDVEYRKIPNLRFSSDFYVLQNTRLTLKNSGHSVLIDVGELVGLVSSGGLPQTYRLGQFHFHWGKDPTEGSEHTWETRRFPAEIHWVFYRTDKHHLPDAMSVEPNGLVVIAAFVEESDEDNSEYALIMDKLVDIPFKGDKTQVSMPFTFRHFFPGNIDYFFRYRGSLTTPPCYESVLWTIFQDTIKLSRTQISKFHQLFSKREGHLDNAPIIANFRPPQPRHERLIVTNDPTYSKRILDEKNKESLLWRLLHNEAKSFEGRRRRENFLFLPNE